MAELDMSKTTTTSLDKSLKDFSVDIGHIDTTSEHQKETYWDYPDSNIYLGYYKTIPELKKAVDALAMWVSGKGYKADDRTTAIFENITGWGEDSMESIINNLIIQKKIFGDAFAEIIRNEDEEIINIKPLFTGDMRVVVDENGIIDRYEQRNHYKGGKHKKFNPRDILHLVNDRIANEIHGVSIIEACKWVIDARNEAMTDYRKVLHRNVVPVRIIEIDTDDTAKRNALITEYEEAIKKGEVLIIPKGTVEIKDTTINIQDPITWIRYLENFFYQALGIPKVILGGSEEFTEASSKIGYLTFEQVYNREQRELEADLFNQLALRVTFNKPASLKNELLNSEEKNTGQTGFQQSETTASVTRNE